MGVNCSETVALYINADQIEIVGEFKEIAVVGGGPAGAYCAFEMARKGFNPIVFDHSHPREKPCGGGIPPLVLEKFPFLEKLRSDGFTFSDLKLVSCTGNQVIAKGLENGFCISRKRLDQVILNMALKEGAKLIKEKVLSTHNDGNSWIIKTDKSVFSSRILIGADGVSSVVRRSIVGPISKNNLALTFGYLASNLQEVEATVKFLAEIPSYIWVFPGKDYINIGIGSKLEYGHVLKHFLDTFVNSHYPNIEITSKYSALLPSASNPEFFKLPCAGANWALIGDAAGHVDPISGEGILYALWGGKLAACAAFKNDIASFDKAWRLNYGAYLEERCKNKEAFYDPLKTTLAILLSAARNTCF